MRKKTFKLIEKKKKEEKIFV